MKIFIICTVRAATEEYRKKLEDYAAKLESEGHKVHLPHRDTNQKACGYDICEENCNAISESDEVHVFYNPESTGTHFDLGCSFALKKKIVVVENVQYGEGKNYPRMIDEWAKKYESEK